MKRFFSLSESRLWQRVFYLPSLLYGEGVRFRNYLYDKGFLDTFKVSVPVFCVGNLTVGGAGKTPCVLWLIDYLLKKGKKPGVLTRGYGRTGKGGDVVVSDGKGRVLDVEHSGDEPHLIAQRFSSVPILVGSDRVSLGQKAVYDFGVSCLVLDDGFQHRRIHRDLNLLCLDVLQYADMFSKGLDDLLLPAGPFREPLTGLSRADIIFLTKANFVSSETLRVIRDFLQKKISGTPIVNVEYQITFWDPIKKEDVPFEKLKKLPVLAVSGLARPESFEEGLRKYEAQVLSIRFPDHHFFTKTECTDILNKAKNENRQIIVTEKDYQRLSDEFPCLVARLSWNPNFNEFDNKEKKEAGWLQKLNSVIS